MKRLHLLGAVFSVAVVIVVVIWVALLAIGLLHMETSFLPSTLNTKSANLSASAAAPADADGCMSTKPVRVGQNRRQAMRVAAPQSRLMDPSRMTMRSVESTGPGRPSSSLPAAAKRSSSRLTTSTG